MLADCVGSSFREAQDSGGGCEAYIAVEMRYEWWQFPGKPTGTDLLSVAAVPGIQVLLYYMCLLDVDALSVCDWLANF